MVVGAASGNYEVYEISSALPNIHEGAISTSSMHQGGEGNDTYNRRNIAKSHAVEEVGPNEASGIIPMAVENNWHTNENHILPI